MSNILQYFNGARPGKSLKRPVVLTDQAKKAKSKRYEEKRPDRVFNVQWAIGKPWLKYDGQVMTCIECVDFSKRCNDPDMKGTFVEGCKNFRKSAISDHEQSRQHVKAITAAQNRRSGLAAIAQSRAGQALKALKVADRTRLQYLFRNAHYVAKNNRPLSDYTQISKLDLAKGLDTGSTYLNEKAALRFIEYISENERVKLRKLLGDAPFFSFLMDGSTDISGDEQETIYLRLAHKGMVHEHFHSIGSPSSTTSQDLYNYVTGVFRVTGIEEIAGKLVGKGSDGASNMTGVKNGLSAKMKEDHPELLSIHCLNHRLELSFRDVFKSNKSYDRLMSLLIGLYYFYIRSNKQKKGLLAAMDTLQIKGILPPKVTGTRWLPHLNNGINSILRNYPVYDVHLSNSSHGNPKAEGFMKMLLDKNLMAFVLMLQDLLQPLQRLSLKLQTIGTTLADVHMWTDTTVDLLKDCKNRNSESLQGLLESGTYQGVTLKGNTPTMAYKDGLIDKLIKSITDRFSLHASESGVIEATRICNLKVWPNTDSPDEIQGFGDEEIKAVTQSFKDTLGRAEVDTDVVIQEWRVMKRLLYRKHSEDLHSLKWPEIHKELAEEELDNILQVFDLLFSLPPTSVSCETTFSQMKLIKTSRRSRLRSSTLNNLMMVRLQSPGIDKFNPNESIDQWLVAPVRARRLNYKRHKSHQIPVGDTQEPIPEADTETESQEQVLNQDLINQEVPPLPVVEDDSEASEDEDINVLNNINDDSDYYSDFEDEESNTKKILMYAEEYK